MQSIVEWLVVSQATFEIYTSGPMATEDRDCMALNNYVHVGPILFFSRLNFVLLIADHVLKCRTLYCCLFQLPLCCTYNSHGITESMKDTGCFYCPSLIRSCRQDG